MLTYKQVTNKIVTYIIVSYIFLLNLYKEPEMKAPFIFGKIATKNDFTDREKEVRRLASNFLSATNSILISPRRWGKSSLVAKASEVVLRKNRKIKFCFVDLNNIRTEEQFYQNLATSVLRASATKIQVIGENARKFMGRFIPNLTFSPGPGSEIKVGLDWKEVKNEPGDIIDLPEKLAGNTGINFIICIDEFQNISEFTDPIAFQKQMRAHWQHHRNVSYCLYGSKRHMMMDVFESPSIPFYKFGDIIFLEKILRADWIGFLMKRFEDTGKLVGEAEAGLIAELADCHPYYVQQLARQSWLGTETVCSEEIIRNAFSDLILQMSMLFQTIADGLSNTQVNFLKAVLAGTEKISSQENIAEFRLGTSANVVKIKRALISKEILDTSQNRLFFLDPLFRQWLLDYYFKP